MVADAYQAATVQLRLDPQHAWSLTPHEITALLRARADDLLYEQRMSRTTAWQTAYLVRVPTFPTLKQWLEPPKPATPEELEERDADMRSVLAGTDLRVAGEDE